MQELEMLRGRTQQRCPSLPRGAKVSSNNSNARSKRVRRRTKRQKRTKLDAARAVWSCRRCLTTRATSVLTPPSPRYLNDPTQITLPPSLRASRSFNRCTLASPSFVIPFQIASFETRRLFNLCELDDLQRRGMYLLLLCDKEHD